MVRSSINALKQSEALYSYCSLAASEWVLAPGSGVVSLWLALNSKGGGSCWNPVQSGQRMLVNSFSMLGGLGFGQGVFWEVEVFSTGHSLMTFLRAKS